MQVGDALVGQLVAERYLVLQHLGSGGFGSVYMAKHTKLNNPVAIKVLHPHLIANSEIIARFEREAEATSKLKHSAIASVHDIGCLEDGRPYMVMEYLSGCSLADLIEQEGALQVERIVPLFIECCEALRYAHKKGLLHRDIKPDNIFVTCDVDGVEHAKLLDFGLAKLVFGDDGNVATSLTESGIALGTPWYMSPEQCQAKPLDGRTDIYSLGYSLYEALAGHRPFPGRTHYEAMDAHLHAKVPPLNEPGKPPVVPVPLEFAVMKALSKAPNDRYTTADEFRDALVGTVSGAALTRGTPLRAPVQLQRATLSGVPSSPKGEGAAVVQKAAGPRPGFQQARPQNMASPPKGSARVRGSDQETVVAAVGVLIAVGIAIGGLMMWHNMQMQKHELPVAAATKPAEDKPDVKPAAELATPPSAVPPGSTAQPAPVAQQPVTQPATAAQPASAAQPQVVQVQPSQEQIKQLVDQELARRQAAAPQVVQSGYRPQLAPGAQATRGMPSTAPSAIEPFQYPETAPLGSPRYITDNNGIGTQQRQTQQQPSSGNGEPFPAPDFSDRTGWDPRIPANWKPGDPLPPGVQPPKPNNWREGMPLPPEARPMPFEQR